MTDFVWTPSRGTTSEVTPSVTTAKFGDGYAQRVVHGINNLGQTWSLTFQSNPLETAAEIIAFLTSKQGVDPFSWIPPGEYVAIDVICSKWSQTYDTEFSRTITVTFEKVYG